MQMKFSYLINRLLHNSNAVRRKEHYAFRFTADYALLISNAWPNPVGSILSRRALLFKSYSTFCLLLYAQKWNKFECHLQSFLLEIQDRMRIQKKNVQEKDSVMWSFSSVEIDSTQSYGIEQWQRWNIARAMNGAHLKNKNSSIEWDGYY